MKKIVSENYGHIFEEDLIEAIESVGFLKEISEGDEIIQIGDRIKFMPLLIEGAIKISRKDDDGDELLLYYLEKGDVCAMTLTCCISNSVSHIQAVAEMDTKIILVPVEKMAVWTRDFQSWREFVFESYNARFNELLEAIDNLAFSNMQERISKYLRDKVIISKDVHLSITHQTIAYDLHTSRVVVSRILKKLEKDGVLKLERNRIHLLDF